MNFRNLMLVALILFIPGYVSAQSQGCLYNSVLYPNPNGTYIVGAFGACPAGTYVYDGATTKPYVTSSAQCSGSSTTAVLGSQYTGPNQTKCVIFFSGTGSFVCSDVYNYVLCPLDDFAPALMAALGIAGFFLIRKKRLQSAC